MSMIKLTFTIWNNKFRFFVHLSRSPFRVIDNLNPSSSCSCIFLRLFLESLCSDIRSTVHKTKKWIDYRFNMIMGTYPILTFSSSQWGILFCGIPPWFSLVLSKFWEVDKKRLLIGRTNPFSRYILSLNGIHLFRSYFWEIKISQLEEIAADILVDSPG